MNWVAVLICIMFIGGHTGLSLLRAKGLTWVGKLILQIELAVSWSVFAFAMTAYAGRMGMQILMSMAGGAVLEVFYSVVNYFPVFQEDPSRSMLPAISPAPSTIGVGDTHEPDPQSLPS